MKQLSMFESNSMTIRPLRQEEGDAMKIPLPGGLFALVDSEDYERLSVFRWSVNQKKSRDNSKPYAFRMISLGNVDGKRKQASIQMHRFILGVTDPSVFVDHANLNTLDNRRCNLRVSTNSQNICNTTKRSDNTSGYKGVGWSDASKKWRARIKKNNRESHLGYFDTPQEAHAAYCEASRSIHGDFGRGE